MSSYTEAFDPRRSGRVSIQPQYSRSGSSSLPSDLLLSLILSKSLLALSLFIARDWLLAQGFSVWGLSAVVLMTGAAGLALWERIWETPRGFGKRREETSSPLYPLLFAFEVILSLLALSRMTVLRFVMLTSFSSLWTRGIPLFFLSSAGGKKALGKNNAVFITIAMIVSTYLLDSLLTSAVSFSGYTFLLLHLLLCGQRIELLGALSIESRGRAHAFGAMGASGVAVVVAIVQWSFAAPPPATAVPGTSPNTPTFDAFSTPEPTLTLLLIAASLLALTFIIVDPLLSRALLAHFPPSRQISSGWPIALGSTVFVGYVGFGHGASVAEAAVGGIAWTAISHLISSDPRSSLVSTGGVTTSARKEPFLARLSIFYRHLRSTIKTILATPDSRKIYFFLCLNLAYMFIQMAYGIWTNSLGLISDSIHMFFDCLALGMGLFASVMATWEPNAKFTYGYSRVETLSGFANGLFLCLISIFIVFEAIQRLLDPPEMNTGQLLVVSSLGLAVNLVGMFATGHNHHGHSHGGGGGHSGHSEAPKPKVQISASRLTSHDYDHDGHSHNASPSRVHTGHSTHDESGHDHSHSRAGHELTLHGGHDHAGHASHGGHGDEDDDDDDHSAHDHANGHSHNMKGVFLHVMADTLGSVGVIISTLLINRYGWTGFDPLASIFIAVLIFASVVPLVVDSGRLLILDMGEEREAEVRKALMALNKVEGLSSYSAARFWSKDPSTMVGSISIQLAPSPSSHDPSRPESSLRSHHYANVEKVTARARRVLRNTIGGLSELIIQVEPTGGFS